MRRPHLQIMNLSSGFVSMHKTTRKIDTFRDKKLKLDSHKRFFCIYEIFPTYCV